MILIASFLIFLLLGIIFVIISKLRDNKIDGNYSATFKKTKDNYYSNFK